MRTLCFIWLATALLVVLAPAASHAEPPRKSAAPKEPQGYRQAIDTALQEVELGNFEEAREQFARAHALFPNARTLRGLGISEFELRHYVSAVEYLEQSLTSSAKPLEGELRRDTQALLTRALSYTGELALRVTPDSATLTLDGVRKIDASAGVVRLEVGDHLLEARAEGYATQRLEVTIRGGQHEQLEVQLATLGASAEVASAAAPPSASQAPEAARSERVPVYKRWWLWTTIGLVAAGAATGIAVAMAKRDDKTEYRAVPSENTPPGAGIQPLWSF